MIDWENKTPADQIDMAIIKTYCTRIYHEKIHYLKAMEGQTRFNESAMQSHKKKTSRDDEDAMALMSAQMETRHQDQMDSLKDAVQTSNELAMAIAESTVQKIQEAMMAVTQRKGAQTFEQPVMPPARQHIAPPAKVDMHTPR